MGPRSAVCCMYPIANQHNYPSASTVKLNKHTHTHLFFLHCESCITALHPHLELTLPLTIHLLAIKNTELIEPHFLTLILKLMSP